MDKATTGAPLDIMSQAAANSFAAPTRRLSASYQGQRFEVPEQSDTTGLGQEYDEMYQGLLDAGEDPKNARKYVVFDANVNITPEQLDRWYAQAQVEIARRLVVLAKREPTHVYSPGAEVY